jgi:hypothetical protein
MIKPVLTLVAALICVAGFGQKAKVTLTNTSATDLTDKVVVMTRAEVEAKLGKPLANKVVVVYVDKNKAVPTQCDDMDGDGKWDEMAVLVNIKANTTIKASLKAMTADKVPAFPKRTNIRFGQKNEPYAEVTSDKRLKSDDSPTISEIYQMEGPAWENDVVGFRNYYDARNGNDIFGKKTTDMVLDGVGIKGQNYHEMSPWGMDILKVANSLGAGAIAISIGDEVCRVGPCAEGSYRFITEGPVRAIFELTFKGVPVGGRLYDVKNRISINAGDAFYSSRVWVMGLKGDETLTTGIVHKHNLPLKTETASGHKIFGTHGNQAYTNEVLGLGLLVPESQFVRNYTSPMTGPGVTETYLVDLKASADASSEYYFFSGWEHQNLQYSSEDFFLQQLRNAAAKIAAKVVVK